jgi:hypothetical protein
MLPDRIEYGEIDTVKDGAHLPRRATKICKIARTANKKSTSPPLLPPQLAILASADVVHGGQHLGFVLADFRPTGCRQYENRKSPPAQVLLIAQVLVGGDEQVELGLGLLEETPLARSDQPNSKAVATV